MKLLAIRRLFRIFWVVLRYRLDDYLFALNLPWYVAACRWLLPWRWLRFTGNKRERGVALRLALEDLGPVFVKFGQILSTRRDLLPADIADELAHLQDRVPPFPNKISRQLIERELGDTVDNLFRRFEESPLASASIAQ